MSVPMLTIHDASDLEDLAPPPGCKTGLVRRDYGALPVGCRSFAPAFDLPLIPRDQWPALIAQKDTEKSWLSDLRDVSGPNGGPIPSRDQDGAPYCWAHSSTSAVLLGRAASGQPYADLSAFAVACIIKGYRQEGGWGLESLEWIVENGIPTSTTWPQQSMSRSNDNATMRADAALHKVTVWRDMEPRNIDQLATCLLSNIPVVVDFNWWSHSVCACRLVSANPFTIWIWNSWGSWSMNGMGVLTGNRAIPDGQCCPIVETASAA